MRQLSQKETDDEADSTSAAADRLEVAARALLALSARASVDLPGGLSLTQLRALAAVEAAAPCSLGALAEILTMSVPSASRLVDRLVAAGVVDRRVSDVSRREVTLRVTAAGRRMLRRHEAARRSIFAAVIEKLTPSETRALLRGLEALQRHVAEI